MKLQSLRNLTLLVIVVIAGLAAAGAQDAAPAGQAAAFEGRWWSSPRTQARLGLTARQVAQIEELTFQSGQRLIDHNATLSKVRLELARLLRSETLSQSEIDRAIERVVDAQVHVFREETKTRAAVAQVLTREQRLDLMSWFEQRSRPLLRPGTGPLRRR